MQKFITLTLAALLVFSLAACGSNGNSTASNEPARTPPPAAAAPETPAPTEPPASETPEPIDTPPEAPPEAEATAAASDGAFTRGVWNGNTYTSEFADFSFTMPAGWAAGTDEELAAYMEIGLEVMDLDISDLTLKLLELTTIYDMIAIDHSTGNNVIVMFENLGIQPGGSAIDGAAYIGILTKQLEDLNMGYEIFLTEDLGDGDYMMAAALPEYGMEQYYLVSKIDKFMMAVIITVADGSIEEILSYFS